MAQTLFKGGISKIEFAPTNSFPGTALLLPMKESKVTMKTATEELATGQVASSGKQIDLEFVFDDVDASKISTLQGYENALTPIFFKIYGINASQTLIVLNVIPIVELQPNEVGKNWKRVIKGTGFADTEANLMTLAP